MPPAVIPVHELNQIFLIVLTNWPETSYLMLLSYALRSLIASGIGIVRR